jgi:type II secretory pathway pseudopilin PulG
MKLKSIKKGQAGLTLIEITLVIAVLLGLISVLFIGVGAYKKGADRAKCILNIATVQKAVRSYQNLYELEIADPLVTADIAGAGKMIETVPACPSTGTYAFGTVVPAAGVAYLTCSIADHVPAGGTAGW